MLYGNDLVASLEKEIVSLEQSLRSRADRINEGLTDMDDCFVSERCETRGIQNAKEKIALIKDGGCAWFCEFATLDGTLINARWCKTQYGYSLRAEMPDGTVVWTTANTAKGLAKKGIKRVMCKRPAWYKFSTSNSGMLGVYTGTYVLFPSSVNYATGEDASDDPIEIKDAEI